MNAELFKKRTKAYALRVIHVVESLPNTQTGRVIGNQLLRSGTSSGRKLPGRGKGQIAGRFRVENGHGGGR